MTGGMRRALRRRPAERAHWVVLAAVLLAVLVALLVQGYTHRLSTIGDAAPPATASAERVPSEVLHGGPVIDTRGADPRTASPAPGTVALTFDDGPDPEWTPRILDVLREHGATATFFAVGTAVIDHPDLARRIGAEGHELGVHTLTHVDLATAPAWRREVEIDAAQLAIIEATGRSASLLRPPYTSTNSAVDDAMWSAIRHAGDEGYLTVLATKDARDWETPDPDAIERAIVDGAASGQVVLLHDGGRNRAATVAALDRALDRLDDAGHRATTVSEAVGLEPVMTEAAPGDRLAASAAAWGIRISDAVVTVIAWMLVITGALTVARAVLAVAAAARHRRAARRRREEPARPVVLDPVTVIVPAYNESAGIEAAVRSIAASSTRWRSSSSTTARRTAPPTWWRRSPCRGSASSGSPTAASPPRSTRACALRRTSSS
ncbi:polysaccharide deacetylase family protein [Microbacterium lacusdiani]